jgi:NADH-quinone oxidoreductase subunit N
MTLFWEIKIRLFSFFIDKYLTLQIITWTDFVQNLPEIYLTFVIFIALIIVGTANFIPTTSRVIQKKEITLSLYEFVRTSLIIVFFIYLVQILGFLTTPVLVFNAHSIVDLYTQTLKIIVILIIWLLLTGSKTYIVKHPRHLMEYPILLLLTTVFLLFLVSSYNLMTLFLSIIGFSLNVYVLLLYDSFNHSSREAGIKYYYLSTFSSGLIISGIFFAYLIFHNTSFISIAWILHNWCLLDNLEPQKMLFYIMIYFLVFGFLFKLAAFPCHLWAPEVYDGSPHPITAIFVLPIKVATFGLFLRLLNYTFADLYFAWSYIIWMSAFFSMIWGCFGALGEQLIKRFIAYSSINQMGFLFMGLASGTFEGIRAALLYLFLYILMNLGFFLLFLNTREQKTNRALTYLSDFNDYAQNHYLYSVTLVIILFSMAGIPPLGGFLGKYFLFWHSFEVGHYLLVITGMATSLIATYYYLRIIKIMWFEQPIEHRFHFKTTFSDSLFVIYILIEFILVWFIIWSPQIVHYITLITSVCVSPLTTI